MFVRLVPRDPGGAGRSRDPAGEPDGGDGWIVVPALNDDGFPAELFDAADVGCSSVAVLAAPNGATVPFLIHSA